MKTHAETRREFLRKVSAASLAALATGAPRPGFALEAAAKPKATADTVILLWMAGGMAHTETFDPKRYAPYVPGLAADSVLSTFDSIPTALDGVKFTTGLEEMAKVIDRGTLIRSHVVADLGRFSTHVTSFIGTLATSRRKASRPRISARGLPRNSGRSIR